MSETHEPTGWLDQDSRREIIDAVLDALNPGQGRPNTGRAWIDQDSKQVKKVGKDKASYYVYWYDPDGAQRCKSCGPGADGQRAARQLKRQVEAQLLTGTYASNLKKPWPDFRAQYESQILAGHSASTQRQARLALANFERLIHPKLVAAVRTATIDQFTAARRREKKRYRHTAGAPQTARKTPYAECGPVSPATVNADLRNLKAALTVAHEWGYLESVPRFRFLREPGRLPVYVLPEHFAAVYQLCDHAKLPHGLQGSTTGDWWRAFLVMAYVATGWRVGQLLSLQRADLDLTAGKAITRAVACGNKGRRDLEVVLHPVAVASLKKLADSGEYVFPWPHDRTALAGQWKRLCRAAGVPAYPPSALRKGFGSLNAPRLTPAALQHLMQHKSSATTLKYYINPLASQEEAVARLYVPDVLKKTGTDDRP